MHTALQPAARSSMHDSGSKSTYLPRAGNVCHTKPAPFRIKLGVELAVWVSNMRRVVWQEQLLAGGLIRPSTSAAPSEYSPLVDKRSVKRTSSVVTTMEGTKDKK